MQIIIDGKEAVLKKGSSFDFIAENRLFSGSDSYTLSITFPLRDCQQNIDIFGYLHRSELPIDDYVFDCEIRDGAFSRFGTLTIVEISDIDVKAQFLEGRAEQNFAKNFDEIYINELSIPAKSGIPSAISPYIAWDPQSNDHQHVALPWISADSGVTHNFVDYDTALKSFRWTADTRDLTYFPYLLSLTKQICECLGYQCDFSEWQSHAWLKKIIVCNILPGSWDIDNYARALPHWTVSEFFEKLEIFLRGEFSINHKDEKISFKFTSNALAEVSSVCLDSVVDEYSVSVNTDGDDCDYLESKSFAYKDSDHQMSNYYSCQWFLSSIASSQIAEYSSLVSLTAHLNDYLRYGIVDYAPGVEKTDPNLEKVYYVTAMDRHFVLRHIDRFPSGIGDKPRDLYTLQPLNEFGPSSDSQDDKNVQEVDFVPACIDYTDSAHGFCLFVNFGSYSEDDGADDSAYSKSALLRSLENGPKSDAPEYFSVINVAYYDTFDPSASLPPQPYVSNLLIDIHAAQPRKDLGFNLRLNDLENNHNTPVYNIDRTRKVTFKFLSDDIPNPRAVFYIRGRRYICEKITATFSEDGMSQLLKGEFWPLLDD